MGLVLVPRSMHAMGLAALGVASYLLARAYAKRRAGYACARPRLAVIVVTSPTRSHPSTILIERLLDSFALVPGLLGDVPITIVCDGVKTAAQDRLKRGMCTLELEGRYREYIRRLRALIRRGDRLWCSTTRVVELPSRVGFGFAVREGLARHCAGSRYALVVQHDRPFARAFDLRALLDAMDAEPSAIKYVCLPTNSTYSHPRALMSRHRLRLPPARATAAKNGVRIAPLAFWYDSTHVARRHEYLRDVFGYGPAEARVRRGQFPEETLGTAMMAEIVRDGMEAHAKYGTYVYVDDLAPEGSASGARFRRAAATALKPTDRGACATDAAAASALAPARGEAGERRAAEPGSVPFVPIVRHDDASDWRRWVTDSPVLDALPAGGAPQRAPQTSPESSDSSSAADGGHAPPAEADDVSYERGPATGPGHTAHETGDHELVASAQPSR